MSGRVIRFNLLLLSSLISTSLSAQIPIKISSGASLGGTGLAGVPIQMKFGNKLAIDVGAYFRTAHVDEYEDLWFFGPAFDAGLNLFLGKRENQDKNKITQHGFYIKAGYGLHKKGEGDILRLQERKASLGWLMEINKKENPQRFFQIQLGPSIIEHHESFLNTRYPPGEQLQQSDRYMPMIYCRLCWFFNIDQ